MTALARIHPEQLPTVAPKAEACGLTLLPKKLPRALVEHDDRALVLAECTAAVRAEAASTLQQFGVHVERLALHYPDNRLSPEERSLVIRDWRRLLGHLPPDILAEAVDDYLMSTARFFPTPGQLNAIAEPMWKWRQALARRAAETLSMLDQQEAA